MRKGGGIVAGRAFVLGVLLFPLVLALEGVYGEEKGGGVKAIHVTSPAFAEGGTIPKQCTCDGKDISPALEWTGIPEGAKSLALICGDPDAPRGTWVHWVLFNLPANTSGLPEGLPASKNLDSGAKQGRNDFGEIGYGGPCPPRGTHRYYFKVYALDRELDLGPGIPKYKLVEAMKGHILAEGQVMGRYGR
jgi:Raf kinase inhibitor-like YbhB/YbcL family protein